MTGARRGIGSRGKKETGALLALSVLLATAATAQDSQSVVSWRSLEDQFIEAQGEEIPVLAPQRFAEARAYYEAAEKALRSGSRPEELGPEIAKASRALEDARRAAAAVRNQLADLVETRLTALAVGPLGERSRRAEELFRQTAGHAEAGEASLVARLAPEARLEYTRAAVAYLSDTRLVEVRGSLAAARPHLSDSLLQRLTSELASLERDLSDPGPGLDLRIIDRRFIAIQELIYPPFYRKPPMILLLHGFTLYVESYEEHSWDFTGNVIIGAAGTARLSFQCRPPFPGVHSGVYVSSRPFHVVDTVSDPLAEISVADAAKLDPALKPGAQLELKLPDYARTGAQVSSAIQDILKQKQRVLGDVRVNFEGVTIAPGPRSGEGLVTAGSAFYPTVPPEPDSLVLAVAGFRLTLLKLTITTKGAVATGELEFPATIADPGTGHPGRLSLEEFPIAQDCQFHKISSPVPFGPWSVGNTEMVIKGSGVVVDFDKNFAQPGLDPASAAAQPSWRGVILEQGDTPAASGTIVSNTGYLRAAYHFERAEVTGPGLLGRFVLSAPFSFDTLQPAFYRLLLHEGHILLRNSTVGEGRFMEDRILAPERAAQDDSGTRVVANYRELVIDEDLEMTGAASIDRPVRWGELTKTAEKPIFYEAVGFTVGRFYLTGTLHTNHFPLDATGDFAALNPLITDVRNIGLRGLTALLPRRFQIFTPDTPAKKPLTFRPEDANRLVPRWVNLSFGGVHGELGGMVSELGTPRELGPTYQPFYVGQEPFRPAARADYRLETIRFVSSAVYESDMRGKLRIPKPVDSDLQFTRLAFTSTGQIAGAEIPLDSPFTLSYWGLTMVKKPGAPAAGVLSVRTGQVFFTAAGIAEPRHFAKPFYLIWGEMVANGALRRLVFDYAGIGQKFDGFHYGTTFVRLSDYDPANTDDANQGFLDTAGTVHFPYFGARYAHVHDTYDKTQTGPPWNSRRIDSLETAVDPGGLFVASDNRITGQWSSDFASMDFMYDYDAGAQDGFLGSGTMQFLWIEGPMTSSIVLKATRSCVSVNDTTRHDFTLGPVAHFGAMSRTIGCGCVEDGQLQRVSLSAELEDAGNANILLRSASYGRLEWMLTPSVSHLEIAGDMFLTVLLGGNVQVTGQAIFTVDRDKDFVEGELDGRIESGNALGLSSVSGDGQLNWHLGRLGGEAYQSIQGRIATRVLSPLSGTSAEGGFYIGLNAPKSEAWVLQTGSDKFKLNATPLPERLTGLYGYARMSDSINLYVFSGGIEVYAGLGGFVLTAAQVADLGAQASGPVPVLPFVIGNVGLHIHGEILGGLVSAGGWADLNVIAPYPFSFQGTMGLEGCVAWVVCGSVDVSVGLNSAEGLFVR
jgi:hypothetical protein